MGCNTTSKYIATAELIGNPTSLLRELKVSDEVISHENLSIIAAGLTGNTMLKKLTLDSSQDIDMSSIAKLLCDASSIEQIYNSNHTLETLETPSGGIRSVRPLVPRRRQCAAQRSLLGPMSPGRRGSVDTPQLPPSEP